MARLSIHKRVIRAVMIAIMAGWGVLLLLFLLFVFMPPSRTEFAVAWSIHRALGANKIIDLAEFKRGEFDFICLHGEYPFPEQSVEHVLKRDVTGCPLGRSTLDVQAISFVKGNICSVIWIPTKLFSVEREHQSTCYSSKDGFRFFLDHDMDRLTPVTQNTSN